MNDLLARIQPGYVLGAQIVAIAILLVIRMADETHHRPRNHLLIAGGSLMAFGLVYRFFDAVLHPDAIRWSAIIGAFGIIIFFAADHSISARWRALQRFTGGDQQYVGPERRGRIREPQA